jgi:thioesterase domain-containing protein
MNESIIYAAPMVLLVVAAWDAARRHYALKARQLDDVDEAGKELAAKHHADIEKRVQAVEKAVRDMQGHGPQLSKFQRRG